jgi:uncharacterized phage-associated protein
MRFLKFRNWVGASDMAKSTASIIAKHIIATFNNSGQPITNLKLQKLLYYSQAWYLALHGRTLFNDRIEAWIHGPVVPTVFREYREFKWAPLPSDPTFPSLSAEICGHIAEVLATYGKFDATKLEHLTHSEGPWIEARNGIPGDMSSTNEITHAAMMSYYRARLNA